MSSAGRINWVPLAIVVAIHVVGIQIFRALFSA
jgi:hypothetical protein